MFGLSRGFAAATANDDDSHVDDDGDGATIQMHRQAGTQMRCE